MLKRPLTLLVSVSLASAVSLVAIADTAPEDAKRYRTSVMKSLGGHIGAASMHVRGLVEDNGFLKAHAEGLASGALELEYLFPAGSAVDESEALPLIWEQPEEFRKSVDAAVSATAAFKEAVDGGERAAIGA